MEKALQIGKTSAEGSLRLFAGVAVSTIILAIGTIILGNILTEDGYGLYQIVLVPALMIGLFRDWGVNSAMTRYVASLRMENKNPEIYDIILAGLSFEIITGLTLLFVSLLSANFVATTVLHRPESGLLISIVSISIFGGSLYNAAQSSFVGYDRMGLNSFTLIFQSVVKVALGLLLVLLGYGVFGAVLGFTVSSLFAGLVGSVILYFTILRGLKKTSQKISVVSTRLKDSRETLKRMLRYGVPISISSVLAGVLAQFNAFLIASFVISNVAYSNYAVAGFFAVLLTFISNPIATVLFPAFAKMDRKKENVLVKNIFASSIKYTALVLVPATMAIMVLSKPMIGTIFPGRYMDAPFFLTLLIAVNLFAVFGNLSLGGFLSGLGETRIFAMLAIFTTTLGIPLGFALIPTYGIPGVLVGNVISGVPSMCFGLYWVWKHYGAKADFKSSARISFAAVIAAIGTYVPLNFMHFSEWINLVIGITIFFAVYLFVAPLTGALTQGDVNIIRHMFSGLGIMSTIIDIPLKLTEKVSKISVRWKRLKQN